MATWFLLRVIIYGAPLLKGTKMNKNVVAFAFAAAVALASGAASACSVEAPAAHKGQTTTWDGACKAGKADGAGVVRFYDEKAKLSGIFLGKVENGELKLGAYREGAYPFYQIGSFTHGSVDDEPTLAAVDEARSIAKAQALAHVEGANVEAADLFKRIARDI
jgi:hypothetical protein